MKKLILISYYVLSFCLMLSSNALAQTANSDSTTAARNSLRSDMWALEFGITSKFSLTSFQGSLLSVKRQLNSHEAIQAGVSLSYDNQSGSGSQSTNQGDTLSYTQPSSMSSNRTGIQVNVQYLYYVDPASDVNLYLGTGPTFELSWDKSVSDQPAPSLAPNGYYVTTSHSNQSYTSWNLGITGVAGVECFILRYLSVHAQYGIAVGYNENHNTGSVSNTSWTIGQPNSTHTSSSSSENRTHYWEIYGSSVLFGLSVYFK